MFTSVIIFAGMVCHRSWREHVEVVENVFKEWISERIREQNVAVPVPRFRNKLCK